PFPWTQSVRRTRPPRRNSSSKASRRSRGMAEVWARPDGYQGFGAASAQAVRMASRGGTLGAFLFRPLFQFGGTRTGRVRGRSLSIMLMNHPLVDSGPRGDRSGPGRAAGPLAESTGEGRAGTLRLGAVSLCPETLSEWGDGFALTNRKTGQTAGGSCF